MEGRVGVVADRVTGICLAGTGEQTWLWIVFGSRIEDNPGSHHTNRVYRLLRVLSPRGRTMEPHSRLRADRNSCGRCFHKVVNTYS